MTPAIRCTELVKEYHTHKKVRALDFVDLEVEEGEVFGLLGPNGAGKTTLVRILATLLSATSGRAEVGGHDVRREEQAVRRLLLRVVIPIAFLTWGAVYGLLELAPTKGLPAIAMAAGISLVLAAAVAVYFWWMYCGCITRGEYT